MEPDFFFFFFFSQNQELVLIVFDSLTKWIKPEKFYVKFVAGFYVNSQPIRMH